MANQARIEPLSEVPSMDHHVQVVQLGLHELPEACLASEKVILQALRASFSFYGSG